MNDEIRIDADVIRNKAAVTVEKIKQYCNATSTANNMVKQTINGGPSIPTEEFGKTIGISQKISAEIEEASKLCDNMIYYMTMVVFNKDEIEKGTNELLNGKVMQDYSVVLGGATAASRGFPTSMDGYNHEAKSSSDDKVSDNPDENKYESTGAEIGSNGTKSDVVAQASSKTNSDGNTGTDKSKEGTSSKVKTKTKTKTEGDPEEKIKQTTEPRKPADNPLDKETNNENNTDNKTPQDNANNKPTDNTNQETKPVDNGNSNNNNTNNNANNNNNNNTSNPNTNPTPTGNTTNQNNTNNTVTYQTRNAQPASSTPLADDIRIIEEPSKDASIADAAVGSTTDLFNSTNDYDEVQAATDNLGKNKSTGGSGVVPIAAGLGAAAAVGVGVKVYKDRKENNEFDLNEDRLTNENKYWSTEESNVVHSERDNYLGEMPIEPQKYQASNTVTVEDDDINKDSWSLDDETTTNLLGNE